MSHVTVALNSIFLYFCLFFLAHIHRRLILCHIFFLFFGFPMLYVPCTYPHGDVKPSSPWEVEWDMLEVYVISKSAFSHVCHIFFRLEPHPGLKPY